ncbi:MAG: RagB/SusD family nutrient uptake outer membrane protein, partial [Odoribacter sp.]|nr:RagB/SusD family nutrient uptake outer membrane protein [Odoribacter sp.]
YNLYKGEALALRAYLHFDLLRLFAPHIASKPKEEAIPYVKIYDALVTPFSTVEEAYGLVVRDLVEAESLMSADEDLFMYPRGYRVDRGFATCREIHLNLYAVQALLARVFWMKGDMDHALYYAKKVIDSEKFPLEDKLNLGEFVAGRISGKETIFGIYTTSALNSIKGAFYTYEQTKTWLPANDLVGCYTVPQEYGNDLRSNLWLRVPSSEDENKSRRCMKIVNEKKIVAPGEYSPAVGTIEGINLIRIPEMYLIAAEALLDKDPEQAQAYFDALIEARGLVKYVDRADFRQLTMQDILDERRREFLQEGQYFFTLKRQNADLYIDALKKTEEGSDEM